MQLTPKQRLTLEKMRDRQPVVGWCSLEEFQALQTYGYFRMGDLGRTGGQLELTELGWKALAETP